MHDYLAYFCEAQVIANGTAVEAVKCIDLENVTPKRQIGVGKPLYVEVYAASTGDDSGNTITVALQTHTAAIVVGSGTALMTSAALALPNTTSILLWPIALPLVGLLRYIGLVFDASAVTGTVTMSAYLTETPHAWTAYDSALVVK